MSYNEDVNVVCTSKVRHLRYERLRKSLEQAILIWPHVYEHKIIGRAGGEFEGGLKEFEDSFPHLIRKGAILSKNGRFLSLTYQIEAQDVDEIISLWVASEQVKDCVAVM